MIPFHLFPHSNLPTPKPINWLKLIIVSEYSVIFLFKYTWMKLKKKTTQVNVKILSRNFIFEDAQAFSLMKRVWGLMWTSEIFILPGNRNDIFRKFYSIWNFQEIKQWQSIECWKYSINIYSNIFKRLEIQVYWTLFTINNTFMIIRKRRGKLRLIFVSNYYITDLF